MSLFQLSTLCSVIVTISITCDAAPTVSFEALNKLTAALVGADGQYLYLFTGGVDATQVSQHFKSEGRLVSIDSLWPGLDPETDAAVNNTQDGAVYFFKGTEYTLYRNNVRSGPHPIQDGWPDIFRNGGVDAAGNRDGKSYFFKGCNYWTPYDALSSDGYLVHDLATLGLPCDIGAAWESEDNMVLSKNDLLWIWGDTVTGPFQLTTFLELCTWDSNPTATVPPKDLPDPLPCNGDPRLCPLPIDQVTLPGSHNAGSGFTGPFIIPPCFYQNHEMSILEQLRFGIRYLDVDPCWAECGNNLGTCHGGYCSGLLCSVMVQLRTFLSENPTEVVMVNFNHEMTHQDVLIPELVRQIEEQLSPFLNNDFRTTGRWPTLEQAIRSGKRLFVLIASPVTTMRLYSQKQWILDEANMASTYTLIIAFIECSSVVNATFSKCTELATKPLIEVSVFGGFGACVDDMMAMCDNFLFDGLEACSAQRIAAKKAPNVLMVDFPKFAVSSRNVLAAVRQQNARNLVAFRDKCHVRVDAVTRLSPDTEPIFFSGDKILEYSERDKAQKSSRLVSSLNPTFPSDIDSAISGRYWGDYNDTYFFKGCNYWLLRNELVTGPFVISDRFPGLECDIDAAAGADSTAYFLKGCHYWEYKRSSEIDGPYNLDNKFDGLPCNIDAALNHNEKVYFFQNNNQTGSYWIYTNNEVTKGTSVLDWNIDAVLCED
jgi:hypothetical protein